ncbi:TadE/TadG family type IV pilus assembly protein [Sphingomonas sp. 1P06PA]|uniref:pilus assembly protein TadG-related protein n=1 Tax=Sphingomonas sp. 1P06PA TaxID=554121 RepID=UPI0039A49442
MAGATSFRGFCANLRRSRSGNVLALGAMAIIPLTGMLGGALDMSRIYLAKSRLQQACDAAALAGRRSMPAATWTSASEATARTFFDATFADGRYGSTNRHVGFQVGTDMVVHTSASVALPTVVMHIFGKDHVNLAVECSAELQLPNSDVMFVLDTTLSMTETNPGDTVNRLEALRTAVKNFHTSLENAKAAGTQVRYGFVPYSSTVNVGLLLKPSWIVDNATYQSRVKDTVEEVPGAKESDTITTDSNYSAWSGTKVTTTSTGSPENCVAPANESYSDTTTFVWDPNATAVPRTGQATRVVKGTSYSASLNSSGVCTITKNVYTNYTQTYTRTVTANPKAGQTKASTYTYWWNYKPVSYDVTALKGSGATASGGTFTALVENNHASRTINWGNATRGACIEERQTRRPSDPLTVNDYAMDVDKVPDSDASRWRPFLPELVYGRSNTSYTATANWGTPVATDVKRASGNYLTPKDSPLERGACPTAARKLAEANATTVNNYVTSLKAAGFTYHDIGFMWGLRLMSPQGLFAAENQATSNGGAIARHLIFMTDGATETKFANYEAFGFSAIDRRRTAANAVPTDAGQNAIVEDRLARLCTIAKDQKNITVWVIAFGTSLTRLLTDCASPNRAFEAKNAAELNARFSEIAAQISQLRLTR